MFRQPSLLGVFSHPRLGLSETLEAVGLDDFFPSCRSKRFSDKWASGLSTKHGDDSSLHLSMLHLDSLRITQLLALHLQKPLGQARVALPRMSLTKTPATRIERTRKETHMLKAFVRARCQLNMGGASKVQTLSADLSLKV